MKRVPQGVFERGCGAAERVSILAALVLVGTVLAGAGCARSPRESPPGEETSAPSFWTCSMHPQVRLPESSKCPICFMDLIPVEGAAEEDAPVARLAMSEAAMKLAEIATTPVRRGFVSGEIRTVGKVAVDERRLKKITAWAGGRLERLFVDYTGVRVAKGDHLVEIYSPELYSAQAELVQAVRAQEELASSRIDFIRKSAAETVRAARAKLRLLGLTERQIGDIVDREDPAERVTIYAPIAGIVVDKLATEGDYVETGTPIYSIAELSAVWVILDVYESDLVWIHYGQDVDFEVGAYPGETFRGRIAFIDPLVDPNTRTVRVRLNADNPDLRLKPDMFVHAAIRSRILSAGRALAPDLAGKYVCPMHPEVVKDRRGICDICEMALVPPSKVGFITDAAEAEPPLVIPVTAPLITGRRAVVYVKTPGTERPTFEGREVVLGPRAGDHYIVASGLAEGEDVVVKGNFKIDSAMQIQAKPSMMSPSVSAPGGSAAGGTDR